MLGLGNTGAVWKHKLKETLGMTPTHQVKVDIYERSGDGSWIRKTDYGVRMKQSDDGERYHLLYADQETPGVPYDYQGMTGDGRTHVAFRRVGNKDFAPIRPEFDGDDGDRFNVDDVNMRQWHASKHREEVAFWEEKDQKWYTQPWVAAVSVFIGAAIFMVFTGMGYQKAMEGIAADISQSAATMADAAKTLANNG